MPPLRPAFVLTRLSEDALWRNGRVGMRYRDLIPERQGGCLIASHIQLVNGGPVPDYVHYHRVRFQAIYCRKGWVRVVYEDQGPPLVMHEGDCVLQPPEIRHRVLECSPGLEVIEISSPAEHETRADHDLQLPTPRHHAEREFGGQRFVHHLAAGAHWQPWRLEGFVARDLGIAAATAGVADMRVVRCSGAPPLQVRSTATELLFRFVLRGGLALHLDRSPSERLAAGDSFVLPAGLHYALTECSPDLELLEVALPAEFLTTRPPATVMGG
jgi:quercetin dioxygenase-like cupin family protein